MKSCKAESDPVIGKLKKKSKKRLEELESARSDLVKQIAALKEQTSSLSKPSDRKQEPGFDAKLQSLQAAVEKMEQRVLDNERKTEEQLVALKTLLSEKFDKLSSVLDQNLNETRIGLEKSQINFGKLGDRFTMQLEEMQNALVTKVEFNEAFQLSSRTTKNLMFQLDQINKILEVIADAPVVAQLTPKPVATKAPDVEAQSDLYMNERELLKILRTIALIQRNLPYK